MSNSGTPLGRPSKVVSGVTASLAKHTRSLLVVAVGGSIMTAAATFLPWWDRYYAQSARTSHTTGWSAGFGPTLVLSCLAIVAAAVVAMVHARTPVIPMYLSAILAVPAGMILAVCLLSLVSFIQAEVGSGTIHAGIWLFIGASLVTVLAVAAAVPQLLKRRPPREAPA